MSVAQGQVQLSWSISQSPQDQALDLAWRETGGPPVEPPTRKGFGTRLIERWIASELGGNVDIDYRIEGVVVSASVLLRGLPGKAAK